jgi:CBS domain-containing protein
MTLQEEAMRVQDVMTKTVASCDADLAAATALMWEYNCGQLPVLDDQGKVASVITDRDICIALGTRNQRACDVCVGDVIYRRAVLCDAEDDLRSALKIMAAERVRRLPVVDREGKLVGILSLDDVALQARHHGDTDRPEASFEDVMNTLRAIYRRGSQVHLLAAA